jgi:hypothetical protein
MRRRQLVDYKPVKVDDIKKKLKYIQEHEKRLREERINYQVSETIKAGSSTPITVLREKYRTKLSKREIIPPMFKESVKKQLENENRFLGEKELSELGDRLEYCPRCGILGICPPEEGDWTIWACQSCYFKLSRGSFRFNESARVLLSICRDLEKIVTGKEPELWRRKPFHANKEVRRSIIRATRRERLGTREGFPLPYLYLGIDYEPVRL